MTFKLILFGIISIVTLAIAAESYLRKNRSRPLSRVKEDAKTADDHYVEDQQSQLGMEATDVAAVERTHHNNENIERRNAQKQHDNRRNK
ncbi:hypothetical protein [Halocynthiibacter sp.]|uniref:hypothetical protein n=1 Tax=Halocynthiibacter sp. TaxID=1979210 RepID=UPI003C5B9474